MLFDLRIVLVLALLLVGASGGVSVGAENPEVEAEAGLIVDTIVVTASREPSVLHETIVPVLYFDAQDIERRQSIFLEDLLRGLPGVSITRTGGYGGDTALRLRGGESNHTKLRIDGLEAGDVALATPINLASIPLTGVRRVTVLRGAQSGVWGSDALSGAILLETTPRQGSSGFGLKVAGGNRGTRQFEGSGVQATERYWVQGNVSHYGTSGINHLLVGDEKDAYRVKTGHATAGLWGAGGGEHGVVVRYTDLDYDYDGFAQDTDANYSKSEQLQLGAYSTGSIAGNWRYLGRISGFESRHRFVSESIAAETGERQSNLFVYEGERLKLEAQATYALSRHRLTLAAELLEETYAQQSNNKAFGDPDFRQTDAILSVATEYEWRPEPFRAMVSLRYDANDNWQNSLTYRLAGRWRSSSHGTEVYLAFGTGVVNPTFVERYGFIPDVFRANPEVKPESSEEISFELRQPLGDDQLIWVGLFEASFRNEIIAGFDADSGVRTVVNGSSRSTRRGLELGLEARLSAALALSGAASFLEARGARANADSGGGSGRRPREIRRPKFSGRLWLDWEQGRWRGQLGWTHVGRQLDTDFSVFPSANVTLAAYHLVHLNLGVRLTKSVALFAKLDNALNDNYQEAVGYRSIGRQWLLGVSISPELP